jgi:hypothetical protein
LVGCDRGKVMDSIRWIVGVRLRLDDRLTFRGFSFWSVDLDRTDRNESRIIKSYPSFLHPTVLCAYRFVTTQI